jgi:RHS repeat-associated protein
MSSPKQSVLCQYRYDPLDRLIGHAQSEAPELQRFYCKSRLATEVQGAVGHSIVQHGDLLLAQQQRHNDGLDTTLLATDLQRSVLRTVKTNQQQPLAYSPYGHRHAESGFTSLLGYNGERPDPVTGHYLLGKGYRAFNPALMRFNSPDSWSPFGKGGLNSYAYCNGNPTNFEDSTGHFPNPINFILRTIARKKLYKEVNTVSWRIFYDYMAEKTKRASMIASLRESQLEKLIKIAQTHKPVEPKLTLQSIVSQQLPNLKGQGVPKPIKRLLDVVDSPRHHQMQNIYKYYKGRMNNEYLDFTPSGLKKISDAPDSENTLFLRDMDFTKHSAIVKQNELVATLKLAWENANVNLDNIRKSL